MRTNKKNNKKAHAQPKRQSQLHVPLSANALLQRRLQKKKRYHSTLADAKFLQPKKCNHLKKAMQQPLLNANVTKMNSQRSVRALAKLLKKLRHRVVKP